MSHTVSPRITFVSSEEQHRGLRALSDVTGAPTSELLRRAVTAYLTARRHEWADRIPGVQHQDQAARS